MRPGRLPCAMLAGLVAVSAGWGQALRSGPDAWPVFRGDGGLSGVSSVSLQPPLALRWTWRDADHLLTSPVIADGRVFVGSTAGRVICLEAATGKIVWSRAVGSAVEAPPVVDGAALYVSTSDGVVMRLQAASGRPRWSFAAGGRIAGSANIHRRGSLATVVVGSYDGSLYGLDAGTGERRWSFTTGNFINGAPSVAGNLVVFGGCDARLHLLSAIDGREVSSVDTGS